MPSAAPLYNSLARLKLNELRALAWKYAKEAKGTPHANTLCIDPHALKKGDLTTHLAHVVASKIAVEIPSAADLWIPIIDDWTRASPQVVQEFFEQVQAERQPRRGRKRQSTQPPPPSPAVSDNDEEDDDVGAHDDQENQERDQVEDEGDIRPLSTSSTKRVKASSQSHASTAPPASTILIMCHDCGKTIPYGKHERFCPSCGRAWQAGSAPSASSSTSSPSVPTQWAGLATFTPRAAAAVVTQLPARSHEVASLPAQVIEKARAGQQYYTLSELLPMKAHDPSTAFSSLVESNAFIMRVNQAGELQTATPTDSTEVASLAKRRRFITSFEQIAEVFFFSLIQVVYAGRPDIQEQLVGLLSLANEITRQYGHHTALAYVEVIRRRHFQSSPPRTHVLSIQTNFDMTRLQQDVLMDAITTIRVQGWGSGQSTTAVSRTSDATTKTPGPCRNFNKGVACFKQPCPFSHVCSSCLRFGHILRDCQHDGPRGQQRQQHAPGTPPATSPGSKVDKSRTPSTPTLARGGQEARAAPGG